MDFGSVVARAKALPGIRSVVAVQERYTADHAGILASAITYHAFFSLFPMLLVAASALGFVLDEPESRARILREISQNVPGLESLIGGTLDALVRSRATTGIIGLVGLAWTGTGVMRASGTALTLIKRLPHHEQIHHKILWAFGSMFGIGLLGASGSILSVLAQFLPSGIPVKATLFLAGVAFDLMLFLVAYRILTPGSGPTFNRLLPGSVLAASGWTLLKLGGSWYGRTAVAKAEAVYGSLAAAVGLMLLLSLAVRVFLYGAVVNALWAEKLDPPAEPQGAQLDTPG